MIPNDHAVQIFKFSEQRWIDKIIDGELSFSCAGAFINQAIASGNLVQGDPYEGIFARLDTNDKRISEMKKKLGKDLEIYEVDNKILLRRKSAKLKPIFCFYTIRIEDLLNENQIDKIGEQTLKHKFNDLLYNGFSNSLIAPNVVRNEFQFSQMAIQPQAFMARIRESMANKGLGFKMGNVDYEEFKKDTFFIEPTKEYKELFYKFPEYKYQNEGRICLKDISFYTPCQRYNLSVRPFGEESYKVSHVPITMNINAVIERK